ncbi:hypothetical protein DL93DRAFT_1344385 [Clavulina sp. PMI_390]|nr:hypothetical protein DL93DRAFT_1344385 [Clavulina sp. PMI_390]
MMRRERTGYDFDYDKHNREPAVLPNGPMPKLRRDVYEGPITYGSPVEELSPTPPPPPQPQQFYAPFMPMMQGMAAMPAMQQIVPVASPPMPSGSTSPAHAYANFAQYGAKPAGVKTPIGEDRPPALMVAASIAANRATVNTHLQARWDVRMKPNKDNVQTDSGRYPDLKEPATFPPTRVMYLVADDLPWAIPIRRYRAITCQDVLDAIYECLQTSMKRDEYFCATKQKREQLMYTSRVESSDPDSGRQLVSNEAGDSTRPADPLRVDWLHNRTDFRGLYISERVLADRCAWQIDDYQDAWCIEFGKREDDPLSDDD